MKYIIQGYCTEKEFIAIFKLSPWVGHFLYHSTQYRDIKDLVDFQNFVIIVWNICTMSPPAIAAMVFRYFKTSSGPTMSEIEVEEMLKYLAGDDNVRQKRLLYLLQLNINMT